MSSGFDAAGEALLARLLEDEGFGLVAAPPARRPSREPAPAGAAQRRFWIQEQIEPGVNNLAVILRFASAIERAPLELALAALANRHEALRTRFVAEGQDVLEVVEDTVAIVPALLDGGTARADVITAFAGQPFELDKGPLWRVAFFADAGSADAALLSCHHIILDWTGVRNMCAELHQLYVQAVRGAPLHIGPLPLQQADYAWQQRQPEVSSRLERDRAYWRERLSNPGPPLELVAALPDKQPVCSAATLALGPDLTAQLRKFATRRGTTPFVTLLAAYAVVLSRYALADDVSIGTAIDNREDPGTAEIVGCLSDMLVLRCDLGGSPTFDTLVRRLHGALSGDFQHNALGFADLVALVAPERRTGHMPLYQAIFNLLPDAGQSIAGLRLMPLQMPRARADLALELRDVGADITGVLEYRIGQFPNLLAEGMAAGLRTLLDAALRDPGQGIHQLPLISPPAAQALIDRWNPLVPDAPADTLASMFRQRVAHQPDAIALHHGARRISYAELLNQASVLAEHLVEAGLEPEQPVAVCIGRSIDQAIALLAAVLAGGAVLALDPDYPGALLNTIVVDSGAPFVIAVAHPAWLEAGTTCRFVGIDARPSAPQMLPLVKADAAAHIVYTSGSTGRPKGVVGLHRGTVNRMQWMWQAYPFAADEISCLKTSPGFADFIWEFFGPLLGGVPSIIAGTEIARDPLALTALIRDHRITRIVLVPSLLRAWLDGVPDAATRLASLRICISSGETLPAELARRVKTILPQCRLLNLYGSSEVSADATFHEVDGREAQRIPIGRPIPGNRIVIADAHGHVLPPGAPGEIVVHGLGVTRGYLGDATQSATRFGKTADGMPFFRTGDLGFWDVEGKVHYLGRRDRQIKISGVRVEPGEIEAALSEHPQVRASHVVARNGKVAGSVTLIAYLVADGVGSDELRRFLSARLAQAVVPESFVLLDRLPLLPNGKIDVPSLPEPRNDLTARAVPSRPLDPLEAIVATAWNAVLQRAASAPDDNFFDLGGSSLQAIMAMARLGDAVGRPLSVTHLFEAPRLADLARRIADADDEDGLRPVRQTSQGPVPATANQSWLWDEYCVEPGRIAYNLPIAYRIDGPLDVAALELAVGDLFARHEALRTVMAQSAAGPVQIVRPPPVRALHYHDLSDATPDARNLDQMVAAFARQAFALERDLPLRVMLVKLGEESYCLMMAMHHVACDGWSGQVLVRELEHLHRHRLGLGPSLPPPLLQIADVARWQAARRDRTDVRLAEYRALLQGAEAARPAGLIREGKQGGPVGVMQIPLDGALLQALYAVGRAGGATPLVTLMTAWAILLSRFGNCERPMVATPLAGRSLPELQSVVGFLANVALVPVDLADAPSFRSAIATTRTALLTALRYQDEPLSRATQPDPGWVDADDGGAMRTMFIMEDLDAWQLRLQGTSSTFVEAPRSPEARVDLALAVSTAGDMVDIRFEYAIRRVPEALAERMANALCALIRSAIQAPELPVDRLRLLGPHDKASVSVSVEVPALGRRLPDWLSYWAARQPHALAASDGVNALSYGELDRLADGFARRLTARGIRRDDRVGVAALPSPRQVAALVGTWRVGAIAVTLDPTYPPDRLAEMLDDAAANMVLADRGMDTEVPILLLSEVESNDAKAPVPKADAAAIIFTSGSTGRAKGVVVAHDALARLGAALSVQYGARPGDRVLQLVSPAFDVSLSDIALALTAGAALISPPRNDVMPGRTLCDTLRRHGITHVQVPAPILAATPVGDLPHLRAIGVGGEVCPPETLRTWSAGRDLYIAYGPCEGTVTVSLTRFDGTAVSTSIGFPFAGACLSVRDPAGNPVPIGVTGDLHIGGPNVALGYCGRADLTAERFLPDSTGARHYRTGDAVRMEPDGSFTFLGRLDRQIKLRGFRIEPGETEAALATLPGVARALANVRSDTQGERRLFAWVVPRQGEVVDSRALREALRSKLPAHLVPSAILPVDTVPLTPNGKTDWASLPVALSAAPRTVEPVDRPAVGPLTDLRAIWTELLGRADIGADENFFEIGGHSLLVVRAQQSILDRLAVEVPIGDMFACPTLRTLAERVDELRRLRPTKDIVEEFVL